MLIGGLAALLFQMLHPLAMAGVADHSNFRKDPVGRLDRTATFLNATTFGSRADAEAAIARVRRIHQTVVGTAPDGRPYAATDPLLIEWVHATEVHSFLMSWRAFGYRRLTPDEEDRYLDEMSRVALALGARQVPRTVIALQAYFDEVRPQLGLTDQAKSARNFILRGVGRWPHELASYGILMAAAQSTLPGWARRQLQLISVPAGDRLMVRPAARALGTAMRWVVLDEARSGHGRQRRRHQHLDDCRLIVESAARWAGSTRRGRLRSPSSAREDIKSVGPIGRVCRNAVPADVEHEHAAPHRHIGTGRRRAGHGRSVVIGAGFLALVGRARPVRGPQHRSVPDGAACAQRSHPRRPGQHPHHRQRLPLAGSGHGPQRVTDRPRSPGGRAHDIEREAERDRPHLARPLREREQWRPPSVHPAAHPSGRAPGAGLRRHRRDATARPARPGRHLRS